MIVVRAATERRWAQDLWRGVKLVLIVYSTDAPIYYPPYGTVGIIAVNVVSYLLAVASGGSMDAWTLEYGNGINPLEWITASFAHADLGHLIGNMFFLLAFGLVVEGKLGLVRFLKLYLLICLCWGGLVDLMTLHRTDSYVLRNEMGVESLDQAVDELPEILLTRGPAGTNQLIHLMVDESDIAAVREELDQWPREERLQLVRALLDGLKGRCLGASGAIFGLLAICMIWAPKNEFSCFLWLVFRPFIFDLSILWYSIIYFCLNFFGYFLGRFGMGTSGLHIMGALAGVGFGVLYLKKGWVNCEDWDLFAVMSGKYGQWAREDKQLGAHSDPGVLFGRSQDEIDAEKEQKEQAEQRRKTHARDPWAAVREAITARDFHGASNAMMSARMRSPDSVLDEPTMRSLAIGLYQASMLDEAELQLEEYIEHYPDEASWARLRHAEILLGAERPRAAMASLKGIRLSQLNGTQQDSARKLARDAKRLIRSGVEDAEPEW